MIEYHNEAMTIKQLAKYLVVDYGTGLDDYLYSTLSNDTDIDLDVYYKRIEEAYGTQCKRVKKFLNL
tara:strand:- start:230 stop:430 length:201 start_codon:yes stop_codon:yes gene_type:complete